MKLGCRQSTWPSGNRFTRGDSDSLLQIQVTVTSILFENSIPTGMLSEILIRWVRRRDDNTHKTLAMAHSIKVSAHILLSEHFTTITRDKAHEGAGHIFYYGSILTLYLWAHYINEEELDYRSMHRPMDVTRVKHLQEMIKYKGIWCSTWSTAQGKPILHFRAC
ncbi:hypothetical protein HAX54_017912 [Datura stramonium]|uniref:Uncharacterized protein n=1 Tax=Datura stramonium TaxID=4076 RepID=A0ABS8RJT9_DATST|nr:hypothetical protein [Datura stramonium]